LKLNITESTITRFLNPRWKTTYTLQKNTVAVNRLFNILRISAFSLVGIQIQTMVYFSDYGLFWNSAYLPSQSNPSPVQPGLQAHEYDPSVLVQVACS
jgi:hypothetical protein